VITISVYEDPWSPNWDDAWSYQNDDFGPCHCGCSPRSSRSSSPESDKENVYQCYSVDDWVDVRTPRQRVVLERRQVRGFEERIEMWKKFTPSSSQ
jgi:hypothetical protein